MYDHLFLLAPLLDASLDPHIIYMYSWIYLLRIGRVAILSLGSEQLLCLVVSLNRTRKKSNLSHHLRHLGPCSWIICSPEVSSKYSGLDRTYIENIAYKVGPEVQMFCIFCANVKPGCSHSVDGKAVQLCDCCPGMWLGIHAVAHGLEKGLWCPKPSWAICTDLYFSSCSE